MIATLATVALLLPLVSAQNRICYDRFNRAYYCNGLSNGARIGIGVGIAAGVIILFALCATMRRRSLQKNFSKYRPPALPYAQNTGGYQNNAGYSYGQGNNPYGQNQNPYANNPPPPQSSFANNQYGSGPAQPDATYQPGVTRSEAGKNEQSHEHGYEWEQAREAERLEREQQGPPGYDSPLTQTPVVTGGSRPTGNDSFAPPPGPPPGKA